jgi:hypothetical protein
MKNRETWLISETQVDLPVILDGAEVLITAPNAAENSWTSHSGGYLAQNTAQISRNVLVSGLHDDCGNRELAPCG